jgi:hypothetical protein
VNFDTPETYYAVRSAGTYIKQALASAINLKNPGLSGNMSIASGTMQEDATEVEVGLGAHSTDFDHLNAPVPGWLKRDEVVPVARDLAKDLLERIRDCLNGPAGGIGGGIRMRGLSKAERARVLKSRRRAVTKALGRVSRGRGSR